MTSSERHDFSHEDKDSYLDNLKDVYRRTYAEGEDKLQKAREEAAGIVAKGTKASTDEKKTLANLFDNVHMLPAVTRIHRAEFPNSFSNRMNKRDMIQDIIKIGIGFPTEAEWQTKYSTKDDGKSRRSRSPSSKSEHHRRLTEEAHKRARTRRVVKKNDKKLEVGPPTQHRGQGGHGGQGGRIHAHRRRKQIEKDGILARRLQQREIQHPDAKEIAMRWLRENANTELELKRLLETPAKKRDAPSRSPPKGKDYRKGGSKQRENQEKENERRRQRLRQEEIEAKRKAKSDRGPDHSSRRSRSRERSQIHSRSISLSRSRSRSWSPSSTKAVSDQWEEEVTRIVRKVVVEVTSRSKEDKTKRWLPDTPPHLVAKGKALQYVSLAELRKKRLWSKASRRKGGGGESGNGVSIEIHRQLPSNG